jgi:conjugal transfer/entry exclusion protein
MKVPAAIFLLSLNWFAAGLLLASAAYQAIDGRLGFVAVDIALFAVNVVFAVRTARQISRQERP